MTNIELVIKIPSEVYENIKSATADDNDISSLLLGIYEATPLPKDHGRLIDAEYLRNVILPHNFHANNKYIVPYSDRRGYRLRDREVDESIINAPTIIKANKEA